MGRGRAPIPWSILKGMRESALTTFVLTHGTDNGPIIHQTNFEILDHDDANAIFQRVATLHELHGNKIASMLARIMHQS
jgi:methionyl-tRNA formyltransferase